MTWQPKTFEEYTPSSFEPEKEQKKLKEGILPRIASSVLSFGQGGMPIFDEVGAYLGEKLGVGGDIPYEERLKNIRETEQAFSSEYPKTDVGLRIAGSVAATAPIAPYFAAKPVLAGASYGASQGFTGAEGGAISRLLSGIAGGSLGAGGGYVADKLLTPAAAAMGTKLQGLENPSINIKGRELSNIEKNLNLAGMTKGQYAANLLRSSPEDFAGELGGEALRMQTQSQAKITGPSMQAAREAMRIRQAQAPERAKRIVQEALGSDKESELLQNALDIAKGAENTLYGAVGDFVKKSSFSDVIDTPAGQQALSDAAKNLANSKINPLEAGFVKSIKEGKELYSLADDVPSSTVHEISKALGQQVKRNPNTGAIEDAGSLKIEKLRNDLVKSLEQSSTDFMAAQDNAAKVRAAQEALSKGRKIARSSAGENAEDIMTSALKKEENTPFFKTGFKQGLYDIMEGAPLGTGNPISRIAQQKTVNRVSEIAGPEAGNEFSRKLMAEKLRMELANRALQGSNTAETISSGISNLPISKMGVANKAIGVLDSLMNSKSEERLAKALYATSPQEKNDLIAVLLSKEATSFVPNEAKRNMMIELLRGSIGALPSQVGGSLSNSPRSK